MKSAVLVAFLLTATLATIAFPVGAAPTHPPFGSFVNSSGVPAGSTLVLNIVYKVSNDEDSGFFGYWALDNYNKQVQVWQAPDGTFYVVARYTGSWQTFQGAKSPGQGLTETQDASGQFEGGWVGTFTGTLNPSPAYSTKGNIGTFDFGGTQTAVVAGTLAAGFNPFDWMTVYFTGTNNFVQSQWGWTYHYRSQTWNNFYSGSSGDIAV